MSTHGGFASAACGTRSSESVAHLGVPFLPLTFIQEHKAAKALSKYKAEHDKAQAELDKAKEDLDVSFARPRRWNLHRVRRS